MLAIDISDNTLAALRVLANSTPGLEVRKLDARDMRALPDRSFDRIMVLGNTFSGMYTDEKPGTERCVQVDVLRDLVRIASEEVYITLSRPASLRVMLQFYRMNAWHCYDVDHDTGVKRLRWQARDRVLEFRSQHFTLEQIENLLHESEVPQPNCSISEINEMLWLVRIRK